VDERMKDRVTGYDFEFDELEAFEVSADIADQLYRLMEGLLETMMQKSIGVVELREVFTTLSELSRLCEGTSGNVCNMVLSMLSDAAQEWREQYEEARKGS
jgi:hypothetical protein